MCRIRVCVKVTDEDEVTHWKNKTHLEEDPGETIGDKRPLVLRKNGNGSKSRKVLSHKSKKESSTGNTPYLPAFF